MQHKHRILVADDDRDILELIRICLNADGYEAHVVRSGVQAIARAKTLQPDGMVLDISMPEIDGFGVLEALKAEGCRLPTLVLTARHSGDDVRRAVGLGAKDYLTKPFSEAQLKARVARLVRASPPVTTLGPTVFLV
jgi:DNA-binding response OmpR family regulator